MDTQPSWWQCVRHRIGMLINPPDTKKDVGLLYGELLMAVASKFPGETRHETALRYIRAQEEWPNAQAQALHGCGQIMTASNAALTGAEGVRVEGAVMQQTGD